MTREEAVYRLKNTAWLGSDADRSETEKAVQMAIEALQEQKTGKWIKETKHHKDRYQEFNYYIIKCSVCGLAPEKSWHLTPFCPNCGARMVGEKE